MGVDAISIDGFECAGHPGEDDVPGLILIPAAADKIEDPDDRLRRLRRRARPGRGAGAGRRRRQHGHPLHGHRGGPIHENIKQQIVANDERSTDLIFRTMRNTARVAKNAISQEVVEIERDGGASSRTSASWWPARAAASVYEAGDPDAGIWSAGQIQGLIHDIPTCAELIDRIVREAEEIIQGRLAGMAAAGAPWPTPDPQTKRAADPGGPAALHTLLGAPAGQTGGRFALEVHVHARRRSSGRGCRIATSPCRCREGLCQRRRVLVEQVDDAGAERDVVVQLVGRRMSCRK